MTAPNPTDTLRQIVMDMHRMNQRPLNEAISDGDIMTIVEAVRALAEAVLQVQMQLSEPAPLNQAGRDTLTTTQTNAPHRIVRPTREE